MVVHRHRRDGEVTAFVYGKSTRAGTKVVHEFPLTADGEHLGRPLCGVKLGALVDGIAGDEHLCYGCAGLAEAARDAAKADQKDAGLLALGEVRAHVLHRLDGWAEVSLNVPFPCSLP